METVPRTLSMQWSTSALETSLVEWKLDAVYPHMIVLCALETSLVEWKHPSTLSEAYISRALETSLVEWKR